MSVNGTINASNAAALAAAKASVDLLVASLHPNLAISVFALIGVITNGLVLTTIIRDKDLHNKSQYVIFSHATAEFIYASMTVIINLRKYIMGWCAIPDLISKFNCMFLLIPLITSSKVAVYCILALAIDRLLAIGLPIRYKNLNPTRYIVTINTIAWGAVVLRVPFMYLDLDPNQVVLMCHYSLVVSSSFRQGESLDSQITIAITVATYSLAIGIVSFRYWRTKWTSETQRSAWSRQIQMSAFRMMMTVGCVYVTCWGLGQVGANFVTWLSPDWATTISPYITLILMSNTASHFFIYLSLSKTFRKACKKSLFGGQTTTIVSSIHG